MKEYRLKLTSVKLLPSLYTDYKVMSFQTGFSLQKLVNRSIHLYLSNEKYREAMHGMKELQASGSNF